MHHMPIIHTLFVALVWFRNWGVQHFLRCLSAVANDKRLISYKTVQWMKRIQHIDGLSIVPWEFWTSMDVVGVNKFVVKCNHPSVYLDVIPHLVIRGLIESWAPFSLFGHACHGYWPRKRSYRAKSASHQRLGSLAAKPNGDISLKQLSVTKLCLSTSIANMMLLRIETPLNVDKAFIFPFEVNGWDDRVGRGPSTHRSKSFAPTRPSRLSFDSSSIIFNH